MFAAIIGPDLGSNAHTASRIDCFPICFCGRKFRGFKARLYRENRREDHKCAFSTRRAQLGLPFDVLISAIGEMLALKGTFFVRTF